LQLWNVWTATDVVENGGDLCLEEMARDLLVRDPEQEEEWGKVGAWEGWMETALGQAPAEAAFAPVVEQEFLIKQVLPATN